MPLLPQWLRLPNRSRRAPARPKNPCAPVRPRFESLEDRTLLTVGCLTADQFYQVWRSETYSIQSTVALPVGSAASIGDAAASASASTAPVNNSFGQQIGLNQVLSNYGSYNGKGYAVAVIDTGIDYNNPNLGGGWGKRVIAGWDFVNNDANPMDDNGHGTNVAGIIGSSSATYSGVDPNVNLIALKVLDAAGSGSFGAVQDALDWVIANKAKYNIVAINLSLGSGNYSSNPYTFLENDFATLKSDGIFISVAAGNGYYTVGSTPGLAFPAVSPNVVSVGAVWDGNYGTVTWASGTIDYTTAVDKIASFSQRGPALSILAPGAMITSEYLNGKTATMAGTSMASPVVAGAAALLHQALDANGKHSLANQDFILHLMKTTGVSVVDSNTGADNVAHTGLTFQRLNLLAAVKAAVGQTAQNSAPVLSAVGNQTIKAGQTLTIGLYATDADGDPIAFSARILDGTTTNSPAYVLQQQYGFTYVGSYYQNLWGQNEKWLGGSGGNWYLIVPNGDLRRWAGTMASTLLPANLVANLGANFYADPSLLWNAQPGGYIPATVAVTGNQLTVAAGASFAGSVRIEVSASDGSTAVTQVFTVSTAAAAAPSAPPVWTPIADQTLLPGKGSLTVTLKANDPNGAGVTYSAQLAGNSASSPSVAFSIQGDQLTITPPAGYAGSFAVTVVASNGSTTSSTTFNVTVANQPPTLADIGNVTVAAGQTQATVNVSASDPNGDPTTITASVVSTQSASSQAYQLNQTYGFAYLGTYFQGFKGADEKWIYSKSQNTWIAILPNGELRKIAPTLAAMMQPSNLVATVDPSCYADPSLLWNAAAPVAANITASVSGNQVTVTRNSGFVGTAVIAVSVSDGFATTTKQFTVTFS